MTTPERSTGTVALHVPLVLAVTILILAGCVTPKSSRFESIVIRGSPAFAAQVTSALILLRERAPEAYTLATNHIGVIYQFQHSGMRAETHPPRFDLADATAFHSVTWCAGSIAHDSYHSFLYRSWLAEHSGSIRVPDLLWKGEEAEKLCLAHQLEVLKAISASASEILWCQQVVTNRYWDVKYGKRNW